MERVSAVADGENDRKVLCVNTLKMEHCIEVKGKNKYN